MRKADFIFLTISNLNFIIKKLFVIAFFAFKNVKSFKFFLNF